MRIKPALLFISSAFVLEFVAGIFYHYFLYGNFSLSIFYASADHTEFFNPVNNWISLGQYSISPDQGPYAGRLPGYGFPYVIFRWLFSESTSFYILGIFQLLLKSISGYYLWNLIRNISHQSAAIMAVFLYFVVPYYWHWDYFYHPNSVSVSVYVILLCVFYPGIISYRGLLTAGTLLAYLVFIRPFTGVYFISFCLFIFISGKNNIPLVVRKIFTFILPFLVAESVWIYRNYVTFNKFIPLQTTFVPFSENSKTDYSYGASTKYSALKVRELIASWGGQGFWYFPGEMKWFRGHDSLFTFGDHVFCKSVNMDSLKSLQKELTLSYNNDFSTEMKDSLENLIIQKSMTYKQYYKEERPLNYWILSKFRILKLFIIQNVTQDWPGPSFAKSGIIFKGMKLFSLFEYFILLLSIIFSFYNIHKKSLWQQLIIANVMFLLIVFSLLVDANHYSLFATGYAGLLLLLFSSPVIFKTNA